MRNRPTAKDQATQQSRARPVEIGRDLTLTLEEHQFVHFRRRGSQVEEMEEGPARIELKEGDVVTRGPDEFIRIPPNNRCLIMNPIMWDDDRGQPLREQDGSFRVARNRAEYRYARAPFPLYPGERTCGEISTGYHVPEGWHVVLLATGDVTLEDGEVWKTGDCRGFWGPRVFPEDPRCRLVEIQQNIPTGASTAPTQLKHEEGRELSDVSSLVNVRVSSEEGQEMARQMAPWKDVMARKDEQRANEQRESE